MMTEKANALKKNTNIPEREKNLIFFFPLFKHILFNSQEGTSVDVDEMVALPIRLVQVAGSRVVLISDFSLSGTDTLLMGN